MIVFKNVTAGYGENIIFKNFSLKIENSTAFMGASGLGKTTFLKLVMGLIEPFCGEVEVSGRVSAVFQEDRLTPYTVLSNLTLIGAERPAIAEICGRLGIEQLLHKKTRDLSGGQKRRVALARALLAGGDILLLDEPFTGLDDAAKEQAAALILEKCRQSQIILVTHDAREAELLELEPQTLAVGTTS